jgi:hypothetical protein
LNQLALKVASLLSGKQGGSSRSGVISEGCDSSEYDPIDWTAATPSWTAIIVGGFLPLIAIVALVFMVDAILCMAFEQTIGHFWTVPIWLVATMAFPLALIAIVIFAKLFMKIAPSNPHGVSS